MWHKVVDFVLQENVMKGEGNIMVTHGVHYGILHDHQHELVILFAFDCNNVPNALVLEVE